MRFIANIFLVLLLSFGCVASNLYAMEKGVFQPPSLDGYTFEKSWNIDADQMKDGIKETTIEKYVKSRDQVILKWATNGKTWYWSILNNYNDKTDSINNYGIRAADGNGDFTERYMGKEQFYLPEYLKMLKEK